MLRNTILSTIGTLIVAAISYYFFTPRPADPAGQLQIEVQDLSFPRNMFLDTIGISTKEQDDVGSNAPRLFQDRFGFYGEYNLVKYIITNSGPDTVENITMHLGGYVLGYMRESDAWTNIDKNQRSKSFTILPSKKYEVLLITQPRYPKSEETFLVNGKKIQVKESIPAYEDPFVETFREYPLITYMLSAIGVVVLCGVSLVLIASIFIKNDAAAQAKNATSSSLATALALVNWIKIENPEKFDQVVKQAERIHARWNKSDEKKSEA